MCLVLERASQRSEKQYGAATCWLQGLGLGDGAVYLGGSNELARSPDAARLDAALGIIAHIPSMLDEVLDLEDGGETVSEAPGAWRASSNDV